MKKKSKKASTGVGRAVFTGVIMTLLLCCFFLFSGVAIRNTAQNLFGGDPPLLEIHQERREKPEMTLTVLNTTYEVDLTGLDQAVAFCQEHFPLLPRKVRAVGYLTKELNHGLEQIKKEQEKSDLNGKIFCQAE